MKQATGRIVGLIPARMGACRFPGKPAALLLGRPMIEHVYSRTSACGSLSAVYVATPDEEIRSIVEGFGGNVIMTSPSHTRATDRVAEAVDILEDRGETIDIAVMVQGDEPMITPTMIQSAIEPMLQDPSIACVNLAAPIADRDEYEDPNTIKVVMNLDGDALYFSRAPIPAFTANVETRAVKQVCVIPFRRGFLKTFAELAPTPLEQAESIDMLRVIEHGFNVRLVQTAEHTHAVDTAEDLRLVENLMKESLIAMQTTK